MVDTLFDEIVPLGIIRWRNVSVAPTPLRARTGRQAGLPATTETRKRKRVEDDTYRVILA